MQAVQSSCFASMLAPHLTVQLQDIDLLPVKHTQPNQLHPATLLLLVLQAFLQTAKPVTAVVLAHNGMNTALQRIRALHPRLHFAALSPHVAAAARHALHIHTHWVLPTFTFTGKVRSQAPLMGAHTLTELAAERVAAAPAPCSGAGLQLSHSSFDPSSQC